MVYIQVFTMKTGFLYIHLQFALGIELEFKIRNEITFQGFWIYKVLGFNPKSKIQIKNQDVPFSLFSMASQTVFNTLILA